ncbi:baculoviral IAP repeat-containing protein 7-like [Lethenteron reissneri]|uniref:baculoviral IAP repeat-containing protein 7-like n=1 Tax=Lethenteron reissneri TaxID=7753 RepID=UPI002AB7C5E5|nr:baculoviral IAP repeat-containing protein 7-like [Lethenteron reissneri]
MSPATETTTGGRDFGEFPATREGNRVLKVKKGGMAFSIDDLSKRMYRLGRFVNCPSNLEPLIQDLVKAGFFYTGKEDKVECFSCKGVIGNWKSGDSAIAKHLQSFPNCTFARSLAQATDAQTSAGASVPRHVVAATNNASEITHHHSLNEPPLQNSPTSLPHVEAGAPSNSEMRVEANRLLSFSTWPESSPVRPADLARAGLYYLGPSDRVRCFYCCGVMSHWEEGDVPVKEHQRHFSTCAFVMGCSDTGNIPLAQAQQASFLPDTQSRARSASPMARTRARNPKMHLMVARLATYQAWPSTANVAAHSLAIAGFYYTGDGDNVKCFHCDGGLRSWERGDNPWYEHGKWFPRCAFLLQQKGEAFVNEIMMQHPRLSELMDEVFRQRSQNAAAQDVNGIGCADETLMKSDVVKGVLEMGFLAPVVESLVRTRYLTKGETYSSVVELVKDLLNAEEESSKKSANYVQEQQKPAAAAAEKKELKNEESLLLEQELKRLQEQRTCKVCMDKDVSVVFVPCGHLVVCQDCAVSLGKCPICRAVVRGTIRTFMS